MKPQSAEGVETRETRTGMLHGSLQSASVQVCGLALSDHGVPDRGHGLVSVSGAGLTQAACCTPLTTMLLAQVSEHNDASLSAICLQGGTGAVVWLAAGDSVHGDSR